MLKISIRDKFAKTVLLGGFWVSPNDKKFPVPFFGDSKKEHAQWVREYLKNEKLSDEDALDYLLSRNWLRIRGDVIDMSEYALQTAKDFLINNISEDERDGEIYISIWPNGLIKKDTINQIINSNNVYELRNG